MLFGDPPRKGTRLQTPRTAAGGLRARLPDYGSRMLARNEAENSDSGPEDLSGSGLVRFRGFRVYGLEDLGFRV